MTEEEKQRVSEQLIFTHVRMGSYTLALNAMKGVDTARLYILRRDARSLIELITDEINHRVGEEHIPEQMSEDDLDLEWEEE
jgi:hypothetical protein